MADAAATAASKFRELVRLFVAKGHCERWLYLSERGMPRVSESLGSLERQLDKSAAAWSSATSTGKSRA